MLQAFQWHQIHKNSPSNIFENTSFTMCEFPFIFFILFCTLFCSLSQIKPGRQDVPFAVLGPIIFIINLRQLNWYWHNCILRTDLRTNLECIYFVSNVCRIVLLSSTLMTLIGRNKSHACIRLYPKTSPRF